MNEARNIFLGFDPGGQGNFGWSICTGDAENFQQVCSGVGGIAEDVFGAVIEALARKDLPSEYVRAAGVDAPLLWDNRGRNYREADYAIIGAGGHPFTLGMLNGAVLCQGPVLATLLMEEFESLEITEVFPSALHIALINLHGALPPALDQIVNETPHERDARTAAYAAWRMYQRDPAWRDLFENVQYPLYLLNFPVQYWMPIP